MEYVAHAHREKTTNELIFQSVEKHLLEVADLAGAFAAKAGLPSSGRLVGLLHDFGKYSLEFQNYILSAVDYITPGEEGYIDAKARKGKIAHAFAGAQHLWGRMQGNKFKKAVAQLLALCVISHHSGLKDCAASDERNLFLKYMARPEDETYQNQCSQKCDPTVAAEIEKILDAVVLELCGVLKNIAKRLDGKQQERKTDKERDGALGDAENASDLDWENSRDFQQGLLARFLLSCLIDADRINSADFEDVARQRRRVLMPARPWDRLVRRLEEHLAQKTPRRAIDELRGRISARCAQRARDPQGMFTLTVPTGGGKTLASLRFALLHAQRHQLDRVIYVIPYTSIIEQNAKIAREILEQGEAVGSIVLEHHSNFLPEEDAEGEGAAKQWEKLSESWDVPVVFTTMVQFLESLFGSGTRCARRMHNLAQSVIIFDEVQTVPVRCVRMFCNAIEFLTHQCGTTALLCTATQPPFADLPRPLLGSLTLTPAMEIMPDVPNLFLSLKRTAFIDHCHKSMTPEDVAALAQEELRAGGSCLVVCNTKKTAEKIYALCPAEEGVSRYYLSTNLCPAHRMEKLDAMRDDLDGGRPVLCVSTQLIECGVDVSFRAVIRLAAGLDSILQAAGRCNRHGEGRTGRVHVARVDADQENLDFLKDVKDGQEIFLDSVRLQFSQQLAASGNDFTMPEIIEGYFKEYFDRKKAALSYASKNLDNNTLLDMLGSNQSITNRSRFPHLGQSFGSAAKEFAAIDSAARSVFVPYGKEGEDLIGELCSMELLRQKRNLLRRAQRFGVNILKNFEQELMKKNALYLIQNSGMFALKKNFYCNERGVLLEPAQHLTTPIF